MILRSALLLGWQRAVSLEYKISPVGDSNGNLLQTLSAVILHMQFESAVYKAIFLVVDYCSIKVLMDTTFLSHHVNSIHCFEWQVKLTYRKIPLLGGVLGERSLNGLWRKDDDYSRPTTDTPSKTKDLYPEIKIHEGFLL